MADDVFHKGRFDWRGSKGAPCAVLAAGIDLTG